MFVKPHDVLLYRENWYEISLQQLLSPQGRRRKKFGVNLLVRAKHQNHVAWFHKHKIETKYVQIRLEMLFNTYLSVKSVKMDIFHENTTRLALYFSKVGEWVTRRE